MASVVAEVDLPASAASVWSVLSDPTRFDDWLTIHAGWIGEPPTTFTAGSKVTEKIVLLGMANKVEWTIEEIQQPTLRMTGTGMAGVKVGFVISVTDDGAGSKAAIEGEFSGQMIVGALGKAVEKEAKKNLDESMAKLASLLA